MDDAESYGGTLPPLLHAASEAFGAQLHNGVPWRCCVLWKLFLSGDRPKSWPVRKTETLSLGPDEHPSFVQMVKFWNDIHSGTSYYK